MPAWIWSVFQLIAIIAFDSHFKNLSVFLSFANILKKRYKNSLS